MTTNTQPEAKRKVWTTEETQALLIDYPAMTESQLVDKYKTTYHGIKLKAHKLGIKKEIPTIYNEEQIIKDYSELSHKDLRAKYNISAQQLYSILKKHSIEVRKLTDFGDEEVFKTRYQTLPQEELELLYNTSYTNIKIKASNLGIKRPKELIKYKEGHLALTDEQIIKLYVEEKLSSGEIADRCGISASHWIRDILHDHGVKVREVTEANRIYELDETFFETINTEAKAYFLGLLASDGCVSTEGYCISISLIKTDMAIIEEFKKALKTDAPIKTVEFKTTNSKPQSALRVNSVKMKNDLAKHSIVPQKSLILQFPITVPDNLLHHYIRGFIDGDGEVAYSKDFYQHNVKVTSTKEVLTVMAEHILRLAGVEYSCLRQITEKNTWRICYKTIKRLLKLYDFLYEDATIFLKRKHLEYLQIIDDFNKHKVNNIFVKQEEIKTYSPHKIAMLEFKAFNYYRNFGFPYIKLDPEKRIKMFNRLKNMKTDAVLKDKILAISGSNFLPDYYFPHMYEVPCNDLPTTMEVFKNDETFKKVIHSRIIHAEGIADNTIRRGLKFVGQAVCNFKPNTAKAIYEFYGGDNAVVWDMSAGWGGRLIGALASKNVSKYIGTDPNTKNTECYNQIYNDFKDLSQCKMEMRCCGSEDYKPVQNSLDLCFTSPPYFNTEKYSTEATQSCVKFNNYELWLNGFLKKTFENCFNGLKSGKLMLINTKNTKQCLTLEADAVIKAVAVGFNHIDTIQYRMGQTMFTKSADKLFRYEPVFVFQKP